MAIETVSGAIYYMAPSAIGQPGTYAFFTYDATAAGWTKVIDYSFDFNPTPAKIAQYMLLKSAVIAEYDGRVAAIDAEIAVTPP